MVLFYGCAPKINLTMMKDKKMYGLHGHLTAKEGQATALAQILLEAAALLQSAEGCHLYAIGLDKNKQDEVWITEIWDTKEAHDKSLNNPEVRALIGKAIPMLDRNPEKGQELDILGGLGIK